MNNNNILRFELFLKKSKQFHISIDELHSSKSLIVINTLIDNAFKYFIIFNDMTVSFITLALYIFNLSTNSEDNNTKFIRLFIDSKLST